MFTGELVTLGPIQREYLPHYVEWLNDWEIRRFLAPTLAQPYAIEDEEEWFNHQRQAKNDRHFAILTREQGLLLGNCGLHQIDWSNRHAVFGIFIGDKNHWSKGYGTDAMKVILRFAFQELNLRRVTLNTFEYNPRAIRSYGKAGFILEGSERGYLYREGQRWDLIYMGILREEWLAASG